MIEISRYQSNLLSSNMYLLCCGNNAIVIDPWVSSQLCDRLSVDDLHVDYIILTHEHYDHISGVNWLKSLTDATVVCSKECGEAIQKPNLNYSKYFDILMELLPEEFINDVAADIEPYSCHGDLVFEDKIDMEWGDSTLELVITPGHSTGSICILIDKKYLFSGDSLLRDFPVITKFRGGNEKMYINITLEYFASLPNDIIVYPGHFETFTLEDRLKQIM